MTLLAEVPLTPEENVLARSMLHKIGDATLSFALDDDGARHQDNLTLSREDLEHLASDFAADPKEALARARESLFAIGGDERLAEIERSRRLGSYLDAYIALTLKLDHAVFPPTRPREVKKGVPGYLPDGLVDMGGSRELDPSRRNREQILLDKRPILEKYKPLLEKIFTTNYKGWSLSDKKKHMVATLAANIYSSTPYNDALDDEEVNFNGEVVSLSELPEGVCRHMGLTFQVLCQAVGIKSRVLKAHRDGVRHSANMVRLDGAWRILDVSKPDYVINDQGRKDWRPGSYKVDAPPAHGGTKRYEVTGQFSGEHHTYEAHDDMYWYIAELPD